MWGSRRDRPALRASRALAVAKAEHPSPVDLIGGALRHDIEQVVKFLNKETNRRFLRGVIGAGNTIFGSAFCLAADKIAAKCGVAVLYKFELMGTPEDVLQVNQGLEQFWRQFPQLRA